MSAVEDELGTLLAALEREQIHLIDRWMYPSSNRDVSRQVPRAHLTRPWDLTQAEES